MPFVTNTTVISNFVAIGRLGLVQRALTTCHIPDQVYTEIQVGYLQGYLFYEEIDQMITPFVPNGWLHLVSLQTPPEFEMFGALHGQLHHGEAACLALAHHRNWVFLTNDRAARNTARRLQIRVSGSIGILLTLVEQNALNIADADGILSDLCKTGYYAPVRSLREIL